MEKTKKEWAKHICNSVGLPVFPLHHTTDDKCSCGKPGCTSVGKHPLFNMDESPPTLDEAQIETWWADNPDANVGVYPGDEFVFIDLDLKKGNNGLETICDHLEIEDWDLLEETFTVKTPTGGFHLYYKAKEAYVGGVSLLPGVDVRAKGGYVVGPGSIIDGKTYEISCDKDICDVREDIRKILRKRGEHNKKDASIPVIELDILVNVQRAREFLERHMVAIEGMGGDNHTVKTSAKLKDLGVSEDKAFEIMMEPGGWNDRCKPSWEPKELMVKVRNGFKYLTNERPGSRSGGILELYEGSTDNGHPEDEFSDLREITFFGDEITGRGKRRKMLIPEWLPAHGLTAILAKRSVGKSVIMLDLALRTACDMDWHGNPLSKDWCAIYLCGEDDEGLEEQYRAWLLKNDMIPDKDRFIVMAGVVDLMSAGNTEHWTKYLMSIIKDRKTIIFVDTWQRATSRGGQSKDEDMQIAVHHIEAMARCLGGPVIAAFHPPKHDVKDIMGSSIVQNSTTAIWVLENHALGKKLEVDRIKGKGTGNYQIFKFIEISLQELDEHGADRSGVIVEKVGGTGTSGDKHGDIQERKAAFAEVIKELDLDRKNKYPNSKLFSVRSMAERIELLTEEAKGIILDNEDEIEWAAGLINLLKEVGITSFSRSTLQSMLRELFVDDPLGYESEDGVKVESYTSGKHRCFRIRKVEI